MTIEEIDELQTRLKKYKKLALQEQSYNEQWMRIRIDLAIILIDCTISWLNELAHRAGYHHFKGQQK